VSKAVHASLLPVRLGGRYRVVRPLGRGAIAEVLLARDEGSGEEVALKVLYPHLRQSETVVERFRREVEIVRRIAHRHVLRIRDLLESDGHLCLVMDFHPGGDLADRLARRGWLKAAEVLALADQALGALGAAHRAGVVHRDVKPSNILVGAAEGELDLRLCDFGLARTADFSGLTTKLAVLGTPEYMAPEVVAEGHADPRSDLYSLAVVLFEAATGRLPFYGDSPYQLMRQHLEADPPRARAVAPEVPEVLDQVIARGLAKDPLDRFASAEEMREALRAPGSGALVPVAAGGPAAARGRCRTCGGSVIEAAAVCADCGRATLRLETERGGVSVLVTGPIAEKLDAQTHVRLFKLLEELSPEQAPPQAPGTRRAPRFPFYVARDLTSEAGDTLVRRLREIGLAARVQTRGLLPPAEILRKVWKLTGRYAAALGCTAYIVYAGARLIIFSGHAEFSESVFQTGLLGILGFGVVSAVRATRPLLGRGRQRDDNAPVRRLVDAVARIRLRQDRRLLGRLLEQLEPLRSGGQAQVARPLVERAALVAEALVALEAAEGLAGADQATRALGELRRQEQDRALLRADLLRIVSRLEHLVRKLARAQASGASDEVAALAGKIEALASDVEAEEELQRLLGSGGRRS
jgi:hypothetical protein